MLCKCIPSQEAWEAPLHCKYFDSKEWRLKKETTFAFGQFTTISGHFFCQLHKYLPQYLSSDGHFEGLNMS